MSEHHHLNCPNCGRKLTENEIYCYFCEMEVSEMQKKHSKGHHKESKNH